MKKSWPSRLATWSARHPRVVVASWLLLWIAALAPVGQLRLLGNVDEIGGPDFPAVRYGREMRGVFPTGTSLFLTFERRDGAALRDEDLCRLRGVVSNVVLRAGNVEGIVSPLHFADVVAEPRRLAMRDWVPFPCEPGTVARYVALSEASPWKALFLGGDGAKGGLRDVFVEMSFALPYDRLASDRAPLPFETVMALADEELAARAPDLRVETAGPGAFQTFFKRALEADMGLNLLGFVVIALLTRLALGTWRAAAVLMGCLGLVGTFVFAALAALRIPIDPLNNALLLMVSIAGVQDYLFVGLSRLEADDLADKSAKAAHASFLTSLTTALGFGALAFSDLAIIREFGVLAAAAALVEWLVMFTVIPAIARLGWIRKEHVEPPPSRFEGFFGRLFNAALPRRAALVCVAAFAVGLASLSRLEMNDDLEKFFDTSHPFRTGLAHLSARRGFEGSVSLDTDIADRAAVRAAYERIARVEGVAGVVDPTAILAFLARDAREPARKDSIELLVTGSPQMEPWFDGRTRASGTVFVVDTELKTLARLLPKIREACGSVCRPYGSLVSYEEYSSAILPSLVKSLSAAFLMVSLVLAWLAWRSGQVRRLPQILFGSFWGPVVLIGLFVVLDLPINFVTSVFGSVLVGITGDNCIQYLVGDDRHGTSLEEGVAAKGTASFVSSLVLVLIAAMFVASSFHHMRHLGLLFAAGFALSFVGDVWVSKVRWRKGTMP